MSYGKFVSINPDELIDMKEVFRIRLHSHEHKLFWAFYSKACPDRYFLSVEFQSTDEAHEWLKTKIKESEGNHGPKN